MKSWLNQKERSVTVKDMVMKKVVIIVVGLAILMLSSGPLFAGITGKVSGRVIDVETGEELPGASIRIDGTTLGNMAGPDGSYYIISIAPGEYSVTASLIGYQSVTMTEVQVASDKTTEVSFKLKATALELEGITVTAERKAIEKDVTASVRTISTSEIKNMPVKEISQILATQVGFVSKNYELHIRGGRAGEALYIVDGVETRDLLGGLGKVTGGMNVSSANIEEISVLKGGFDAEYGNVQSAVINLVTKEGSNRATSGHLEFLTDDFGASKLNDYSFNSDRMEFSLNGPDPFFTTRLLPALGIKFLGEKVAYYISGTANKSDTYYQVNKYATPLTAKQFRVDHILGFDIPERMNNEYSSLFKLTYRAAPDKKLVFSAKGTWDRYSLFYNPSSETRGDVNIWKYRYTPSTIPQIETHTSSLSLLFTHNVSKSSFYEVQFSRYTSGYLQRPGNPDVPGGSLDPGGFELYENWEWFTDDDDANKNGTWDPAERYLDVNQNGGYDLGEPFEDKQEGKNGVRDPGEPYQDVTLNGEYDYGEPFTDLPSEGRWNDAEHFTDTPDSDDPNDTGNGVFDPEKQYQAFGDIGVDEAEPYIDGDINKGEPFEDLDENGVYEPWVDYWDGTMDLNGNGAYDGPDGGWSPGIPFEDRNDNGRFDYPNGTWDPGEYYTDLNGNGKWDDSDGFYDRGHERRCYYQDRGSTMLTVKLDFTSQINKEHQIRTGFSVARDKFTMGDIRYPYYGYDGPAPIGPWPTRGVFRDFYTHRPVRGALYFQDKIEYGAMVAKLGLRYDWFIQSGDIRGLASEDTPTEADPVDTRRKISPRMGVSYPITDKAKIYFNYGHFYQLPELHWMYAEKTQGGSAIKLYGNYNLDYMKQVAYEMGVDYAISPKYKLTVSGFYKDYYSQLNTEQIKIGPTTFEYYANTDYARSRGLETELNKRYGGYISGYINYQYAFAYGKSSAEVSNYYDRAYAGDIPIQEFPLEWDVRHQVTLNLDLRVPQDEHPRVFGFKLPDKWGMNAVWQYGSGLPFTPEAKYPGLVLRLRENPIPNSKRLPPNSTVNVKVYKDFQVWRINYSFQVWVDNLFDRKDVLNVGTKNYSATGRPDTEQNYFDSIWGQNIIYLGREIEGNPLHMGQGRNIKVGVSVNF